MRHWLAILMLFPALLLQADDRAYKLAVAGVAEFTAAYEAWDGDCFDKATELFRQATTNAPRSSIFFYWLGVAHFHRLLQLQTLPTSRTNQLAANAAMDAALNALTSATKLDGQHAESQALLGTLYGMKIGDSPLRALRFGPRVAKCQKQALVFGMENPRVRYLLGTCQFHTAKKPAAQREALTTFLAADALYLKEVLRAAEPLEPRWGHSTCLTFIGRSYELLGQRSEAADYFRKALAQHPADHVARQGLARVTENK